MSVATVVTSSIWHYLRILQRNLAGACLPEFLLGDRLLSMLQALAATTRSVLSGTDTSKDVTAREVLTASASTIQNAITQGVYGSGQGRAAVMEHQVATMQS